MELENTPNEPQPQGAQPPSAATGQNGPTGTGGGGRRRRRRRGKKPGGGAPGAQAQPQQPQGQQQNRGAQHHRQNRQNQGGHAGQNGGGQHSGRKGGGGRRRRGGGGTPFVGPMDHSYRGAGANGNVADRQPGSNMGGGGRFRHNGRNGDLQPHYIEPEVVPVGGIREDAPPRIFCFIEDLFFLAKINEISRKLGTKVEFVKTVDPILERAGDDVPEDERPALIIFDLNNANVKPFTLIPKLRAKLKKSVSIVGFLQHIQGDLKVKAIEAGCDMVVPRSAFSQNLPNLLRRHAETEVEDTPQPGM